MIRASLLCLSLLVTAGVALAGPKKSPRTYALREVLIEGSITPVDKKRIDEELVKRFMMVVLDAGTSIEPERVQKLYAERPHLRDCRDKNCLVEAGDYLQVDRLLSVVLERSGPPGERADWEVRMMLFAVDAVKYTDKQTMPCKSCTLDEVMRDFGNTVAIALKQDKTIPLCTIRVSTAPPGGTVLVDGEAVGLAPFEHTIEAGRRTIGARADQSTKNETEIDCPIKGSQNVTFKLDQRGAPSVVVEATPAPAAVPSLTRPLLYKALGGAFLGLGVLGWVGAVAGASTDGKGTCEVGNCPRLYDNHKLVIGTAIAGTVLVGAGIGLLVKGILESKRPKQTTWFLAPTFGAQSVGAAGQFHY